MLAISWRWQCQLTYSWKLHALSCCCSGSCLASQNPQFSTNLRPRSAVKGAESSWESSIPPPAHPQVLLLLWVRPINHQVLILVTACLHGRVDGCLRRRMFAYSMPEVGSLLWSLKVQLLPVIWIIENHVKEYISKSSYHNVYQGCPGGSDSKESACNAGDLIWSLGLEDPLENKPTPVFLPGEHMERRAWQALSYPDAPGLHFTVSASIIKGNKIERQNCSSYCFHCIDEDTESPRGQISWPEPHSQ